jgi:hypothetical protein
MTETALAVGDLIYTYDQMDEMPVGTVICETNNEGRAWEKRDDGFWHSTTGTGTHTPQSFSMDGYNKVLTTPGEAPPPPPPETLMQYQWKFRENAISGASENGVSMTATMEGLKMLGVSEPFPLGPGVKIKALDTDLGIPENTVAGKVNCTPDHDRYTLWVWRSGNWRPLFGRSGLDRDIVIVEMPGVTETPAWWTEVGNEETEQQVADFKAHAWRIGKRIKQSQSWCSTYEHVVARVGVTASSVRASTAGGFAVGETIGQRDASRLPVGSLLLYTHELGSWAIYRREDPVDNMTRTRRMYGHRAENMPALGHYQALMTVLAMPVAPGGDPTIDADQVAPMMERLPIGAVVDYAGSLYVRCLDRQYTSWRSGQTIPERGAHDASAFASTTNNATLHTVIGADA